MSELFSLLENPIIQLFLIAGATMGLTWISEREEQRRAAQGLPRRALSERVVQGLGLAASVQPVPPQQEDIWVTAARELELPLEKVMQLKEWVQQGNVPQVRKMPNKKIRKAG